MNIKTTVLFASPQSEIAALISDRIAKSRATSIVAGFATAGGIDALADSIKANPNCVAMLIVGAATYPAFQALDQLIAIGVSRNKLFVHLGHTKPSLTNRHPTVRYHPMMHSKIYYIEMDDGQAAAFVGSHNVTSYALKGLNAEAAVLLEGPSAAHEFDSVRNHIEAIQKQATMYSQDLKEAYAWWTKESFEGLSSEVQIPTDSVTTRTILIFAKGDRNNHPRAGAQVYFEIPVGVEQIENLKTEVHIFLFDIVPHDPEEALQRAEEAHTRLTCVTTGADNKQGNKELIADWQIEGMNPPVLYSVPGGLLRPMTASNMQQVSAEVKKDEVDKFEYFFHRERAAWDPEYISDEVLPVEGGKQTPMLKEAKGNRNLYADWMLVKNLIPRGGVAREKDQAALELVKPESGSLLLVSLRRRKKKQVA